MLLPASKEVKDEHSKCVASCSNEEQVSPILNSKLGKFIFFSPEHTSSVVFFLGSSNSNVRW